MKTKALKCTLLALTVAVTSGCGTRNTPVGASGGTTITEPEQTTVVTSADTTSGTTAEEITETTASDENGAGIRYHSRGSGAAPNAYIEWYEDTYFFGTTQEEYEIFHNDFMENKSKYLELPCELSEEDIADLKNYEMLTVYLTELTDLSFISELPQLKSLNICEYTGPMPGAEPLEVSSVKSFDFLADLPDLMSLRITSEPSFSFAYLWNNTKIESMCFDACIISASDIVFENVRKAFIGGTDFPNSEICRTFPNIENLNLYNSWDGTIGSISELNHLKELEVWHGTYEGINAICGNSSIEIFTFTVTPARPEGEGVDFAALIESMPSLTNFHVFENMLTEDEKSRIAITNPTCEVYEGIAH